MQKEASLSAEELEDLNVKLNNLVKQVNALDEESRKASSITAFPRKPGRLHSSFV
jgi:hypothetical protein